MSEMKVLINRRLLAYEGLFRADELYAIIRKFASERGYFAMERVSEEHALTQGKEIILELELLKNLSDYAKSNLVVQARFFNVADKVVEIDKRKHKYQHGRVEIHFSAKLMTDYRGRWEGSGFAFLFRTISDKFIRHGMIHELETRARTDCAALQEEISVYLNMHRFKVGVR